MRATRTLILAMALACAGCGRDAPPDVVIVTIDRLRWEELSPWGGTVAAPALESLKRSAASFDDAASLAPGGAPAAITVLTGRPPSHHGVRAPDEGRVDRATQSLADRLGSQGWATGAFLQTDQVTVFMQADRAFAAWDAPDPGFPTAHPGASRRRGIEETVAPALHWLRRVPEDQPALAWVHLAEPAPPEMSQADRAARLGELDRMVGALLDGARARGRERGVPPILISCNLSSHGADPARAAAEAFLMDAAALRVRVLCEARGLPPRSVRGLAGLDEVAGLAEALATGAGASRLLDMARGGGERRETVVAASLLPLTSVGARPLAVALRETGPARADDDAVTAALASDASWPQGLSETAPEGALPAFLDIDAAWTLLRRGRTAEAAEGFRARAEGSPAPPGARVGLGLALLGASRESGPAPATQALEQFRALEAESRPGSFLRTQARLGQAQAARSLGDVALARAALDAILADDRADLRALTWLAEAAEASGDRKSAVESLLAMVEQDPDNPYANTALGRLYLGIGRPRDAAAALERALQRQPTNPQLMLAAADALASAGDWWTALDRINERITLYGASPETDFATARCWRDTGRWELAAEYFGRYAKARPEDPRGHLGLGEALLNFGRQDDGLAALRRARDLAPQDPAACGILARYGRSSGADVAAQAAALSCP